jgi:hypothetical protein
MAFLLTALIVGFGLTCGYGYACWLLPERRRTTLILVVATLGLSLGMLTLVMFWIALLFPGRLDLEGVLGVCVLCSGLGLWLSRGRWLPWAELSPPRWSFWLQRPALAGLASIALIVSAGVIFNAAYWPFVDWDALAIYAPLARIIYHQRALPVDSYYAGYPMLVPLSYAYTHWSAGGLNEHWARLIPAFMALGGIGAAAALARQIRSRRAAWIASGLIALTPLYNRWASSGYTDVPVGFYFTLSALFACRWRSSRTWQDAVLTGAAAGLAMWTKNDALTLLMTLFGIAVWMRFTGKGYGRDTAGKASRRQALYMLFACLAIAGPWYIRNAIIFGQVVPPTAWVSQAQHTLSSLTALLQPGNHFGAPGWLFFAAVLYGLGRTAIVRERIEAGWVILLAYITPFFAAWWLLASYETRFLVTLVPLLAAAAALMIDDAVKMMTRSVAGRMMTAASWIAALLVLAMAPAALLKAVDGKRAILRNPWMDDADKRRVRLGGTYDLAQAINRLPAGSRVVGVPSLAMYHIDQRRLGTLSQDTVDTPPHRWEDSYDYVVYFFDDARPSWTAELTPIFQSEDGYALYPTKRSNFSGSGFT